MSALSASAFAPGRCTVVGEHVDYADGVVVCMAVHLGVTVTLTAGGPPPESRYVAATLSALHAWGVEVPPVSASIEATLPVGAGLSSSAALCCATAAAALRLVGARLPAATLCEVALHAERDILGVPCGPLDQRAVVLAPADGALVLDCRDDTASAVPWLPGHVLIARHTGESHDVGGEGYRTRRAEAGAALRALGAASWRDVPWDPTLPRRARHIVGETQRALDCAGALRRGDAPRVGALMTASHTSLRDDYEVSTPALDAAVAAFLATPGCLGARLVGAGFGGTAVALFPAQKIASDHLAPEDPSPQGEALGVSPGLAALAPDVIA